MCFVVSCSLEVLLGVGEAGGNGAGIKRKLALILGVLRLKTMGQCWT